MAEFEKHSDITTTQNKEWEAKYGKARIIDLKIETQDGTVAKFVLRKPDRSVLELMAQHGIKNDIKSTNRALIKNCVLGGDMEALEKDGEVYLEILTQLNKLKHEAKSTVKKR
jgi:hypothetical protein